MAATEKWRGEEGEEESDNGDERTNVAGLMEERGDMEERHEELDAMDGVQARAEAARDFLLPLVTECRRHADALEGMVHDGMWPLPKYNEMLWQQ